MAIVSWSNSISFYRQRLLFLTLRFPIFLGFSHLFRVVYPYLDYNTTTSEPISSPITPQPILVSLSHHVPVPIVYILDFGM